jgi:hypothetical protein
MHELDDEVWTKCRDGFAAGRWQLGAADTARTVPKLFGI